MNLIFCINVMNNCLCRVDALGFVSAQVAYKRTPSLACETRFFLQLCLLTTLVVYAKQNALQS